MKHLTDTFSTSIFTVLTVSCKCNSSGNKVLDVIAQWTEWTLWRGKYKGDVIKYSVCRSALHVRVLPGRKTSRCFSPWGWFWLSPLCQISAWAPGCPSLLSPCSCTPCALFFPLSAGLKRAGREQWGIWDKDGTRALLQRGVLYSKDVCKNIMHWEDSKQPGGKTKYAKDICSECLGKKLSVPK